MVKAKVALILIHGRGASAEDIYSLGEEVSVGVQGVALLAPQAAGNVWYPQRFLAPLEQNEPYLGSALGVIGGLVGELVRGPVPATSGSCSWGFPRAHASPLNSRRETPAATAG